MRIICAAILCCCFFNSPLSAQQFDSALVFGDSTVDSGWWRGAFASPPSCDGVAAPCTPTTSGTSKKDKVIHDSIYGVGGGATGTPAGAGSLMNSQLLAAYFGLSADPANQPGGTSFAISGAVDNACGPGGCDGTGGGTGNLNSNPNLPSTVTQIAHYLAERGGVADPSALYYFSSGGNDISYVQGSPLFPDMSAQQTFLSGEAASLAQTVADLKAAGGRYFVVDSAGQGGALSTFYTNTLWSDLAAAGVNFVPADVISLTAYIQAHPVDFGFTSATVMRGTPGAPGSLSTNSACVWKTPSGGSPNTGWGQWCSTQVNPNPSNTDFAYLVSATAEQDYLFSDDEHFTAAGQKIEADYVYSLLTAPSQISMLAENAIKSRTTLVSTIQRQIDVSQTNTGPGNFDAWVTGDIGSLKIDNYPGFPDDPNTPLSLVGGLSYRVAPGLLVGGAVSIEHNGAEWEGDRGKFTQDEYAGSLYGAYDEGPLWGTLVATYGSLHYDVDRDVPLGLALLANSGTTHGSDWSVGAEFGYDFVSNKLKTGPVAGILWQQATVDGFVESGGVTSLGFLDQSRISAVSTLGWRAKLDWGDWQPFAQVVWNHELAGTDRSVTAFLTSTSAPSYDMPAVAVGRDWATATLGTTVALAPGVLGLGSVETEFGQDGVVSYGGQIGVNMQF